ncbi:hypothetical protein [Egbenema bharatensis]|uniref:hypothetical protein n=1 Tax=Egbenema bharatensis TaxID=3463334 RepID=UPI003A862E32
MTHIFNEVLTDFNPGLTTLKKTKEVNLMTMQNRFISIDPVNKTILESLNLLSQALELDDHQEKIQDVATAVDYLNVLLQDDEKHGIPGFQPYTWQPTKKSQN